jgi:Na+-transporting NADH:ubiquinone oxidoreductase subunit NqrB
MALTLFRKKPQQHKQFVLSPSILYQLILVGFLTVAPAATSWRQLKEIRLGSSAIAVLYSIALLSKTQSQIDEADRLTIIELLIIMLLVENMRN